MVQSEISTWRVVLAVAFGILYEKKILDCEPYIYCKIVEQTTGCSSPVASKIPESSVSVCSYTTSKFGAPIDLDVLKASAFTRQKTSSKPTGVCRDGGSGLKVDTVMKSV